MSYVTIATNIVTLLEEITDLQEVHNHEPKELAKYPCATVTSIEHENAFNDTAANKRRYSHIIRCYYRTEDPEDAETVLRGIADKVIAKIEGNIGLGGACDFATPTRGKWGYAEKEVPIRYVEITVDAFKRVNR